MSLYLRGRIWWSDLQVDGRRVHFTTRTSNKNTARSVEAVKRTELVKGLVGLTAPTLQDFSTRFINSLDGRVGSNTIKFYTTFWKPLMEFQPLATCRLDRINMSIIEDFVQWRQKTGLSATTVNHSLRTLRRALHLATEWDLIKRPPKIKLLGGENQRDYVITPEVEQQFAEAKVVAYRGGAGMEGWLVSFFCDTGLRRSELSNLGWKDINFDEKYIFLSKGKTKYSRRKIPFTTRVEKTLLALKGWAPKGNPYVFLHDGRRMTKDWLSHAFLRTRKQLGLPDACVLHSTRHTFCTRLGERGADAFAIQRLAGHSSILISQRYVHPSAGKLDAAIALLEDSNA